MMRQDQVLMTVTEADAQARGQIPRRVALEAA